MFPWRNDAKPVKDLSAMRRFMPFISPRRNDSLFLMMQEIQVDAALEYLEKKNRERPPEQRLTLFHLFLRSISQVFVLRPGVNRFVKAGRLWQREGVYLTFSAKRKIEDGSPMLTIKRRFHPESESLEEMVDGVMGTLRPQRAGKQTQSDKEMSLLLKLPNLVIQLLLKAADFLDYFGLLPKAITESDPLYSSAFIANLGSIDYPAGFHHLWERGTCSIFGVMGRVEERPDGKRSMQVAYTYDERIEDGLYSYHSLEGVRERIEDPELLELSTDELARRASDGSVR
ncbi:MAG: hypothetical protein E2O66_05250 [Deltaproteobacteria bacterium]|nr:hypothetical protein [Myxococcales bacterium]TDJ13417.1 MAG: hypothetical protein E2O66_05250 [Deltaproteobacteria bacterium]